MGYDIRAYAERQDELGVWQGAGGGQYFGYRDYELFGWLADVCNFSDVSPISEPRGIPPDVGALVGAEILASGCRLRWPSWLTVSELTAFDYDNPISLCGRVTRHSGQVEMLTYREFLGARFFRELDRAVESGAERLVFWFDG